jgi:TolA-binding protein
VRRHGLALGLVVLLAGGCALFTREATRALADADARTANGDYSAALVAYDAYLARYPDDDGTVRARAVRAMVAELVAARAEVVAARAELAALRDRQRGEGAELARLRQELSARQAEVARLKEDLEKLKRTDLQMERRRR